MFLPGVELEERMNAMKKFKAFATVLAVGLIWPMVGTAQDPDSHAQHEDKQPAGDQDLASQIAELHAKVAKLEAVLKQNSNGTPSDTSEQEGEAGTQEKAGGDAPSDRVSAKFQNCIQCHQTRPRGPLPPSHLEMAGDNNNGTAEAGAADGQGAPGPGAGRKMRGQGKSKGMMGKGMGKSMRGGMGMEKMGSGMGKGMGGGEAEMGGSTSEAMDQQMKQIQQQMKQMQQQMQQLMQMQTLQMKVMELQMKVMEMK